MRRAIDLFVGCRIESDRLLHLIPTIEYFACQLNILDIFALSNDHNRERVTYPIPASFSSLSEMHAEKPQPQHGL